jgi:hypothetical protein
MCLSSVFSYEGAGWPGHCCLAAPVPASAAGRRVAPLPERPAGQLPTASGRIALLFHLKVPHEGTKKAGPLPAPSLETLQYALPLYLDAATFMILTQSLLILLRARRAVSQWR